MDGARRFRTQLGGFNKDDVNGYIKETDLKHAAELEAVSAERDALRANAASAEEELSALTEKTARQQ